MVVKIDKWLGYYFSRIQHFLNLGFNNKFVGEGRSYQHCFYMEFKKNLLQLDLYHSFFLTLD